MRKFFNSLPRLFLLTALFAAGFILPLRAEKPDRTLEEVLQGIERYYEGLTSLIAAFDQTVEVPVLEKRERYRGNFYFSKPDLVRLEYTSPKGQLMVADGRYYWFYQPQDDISQAMRAPMEEAGASVPRYILGGDLTGKFKIELTGMDERGGSTCYVLDLVPRESNPYYQDLRAWVDRRSFATRTVRYEDESGNFNTFDLKDLRENIEIKPNKFEFVPPPGTQVLEAR